MNKELEKIKNEIQHVEAELEVLPPTNIFFTQNGKYVKWYYREDGKQVYIPKEDRAYAELLVKRKYLLCSLQDLKKRKKAIEAYLKVMNSSPDKVISLFKKNPEYLKLLSSHLNPISKDLSDWAKAPYPKNPNYPEKLIHKTMSGIYVRSKSEVLIDLALSQRNIPFRYECLLELDGVSYYPDFTILDPKSGNLKYWEHLGMMDDEKYRCKNWGKLEDYAKHGIIPSVNLIITYETLDHPLNIEQINKTIDMFF